jgi:DprA winged helix domain
MTAKPKKTTQPGAAHSGPDAPPPQPAGASPGPPADGPAAAVWAALTANPVATAAQIAAAAGTSRAVASRELTALHAAGYATRTAGTSSGRGPSPAAWHPATPGEQAQPGAAATGTASPPASSPAPADGADASEASAVPDGEPETAVVPEPPRQEADRGTGAGGDTAVPAESGDHGRTGAGGDAPASTAGDTAAGEREDAPGQGSPDEAASPDTGTAPAGDTVPEACSQAAQLLDELAAAASHAASVLRDGQVAAALPAIEEISGTAAQARRLARSAASGRRARGGQAARPGQLRDLVAGHLAAYPGAEFTPHAIGRVLGRSSGAVANALDRLTALGQAQLTSDHPRRYKAAQAARSYLAA